MNQIGSFHQPVMADDAIEYLNIHPEGAFIDATSGGGGYTILIAQRLGKTGRILAIDRDAEAVAATRETLTDFASQVTVVRGAFGGMRELARGAELAEVNGIVFDLGVSGRQLDSAERGFSYRQDGPLDFRMDRNAPVTAADIVNSYPKIELRRILFEYGEEKNSTRIAGAIVEARGKGAISTTGQLADVISSVTNPRFLNKTLSRCFQAVRLEVNRELDELRDGLDAALDLLAPQGRLVVISYHSLEDRIVKWFFREAAGADGRLTILTKKPRGATAEEIRRNPRARSAKMRVAEKK